MSDEILRALADTIKARRDSKSDTSYTRQLLDKGPKKISKKLGEEAVETVIAALAEDDEALKGEAADVIYHLLVLLESRDIRIEEVLEVLKNRMGISGLEEKASRVTG